MAATILMYIPLLFSIMLESAAIRSPCEKDQEWIRSHDLCFWVAASANGSTLTWRQSRRQCQQKGADLAIIKTDDKHSILTYYLQEKRLMLKNVWIGLRTHVNGTGWVWVDGTLLSTIPNQPVPQFPSFDREKAAFFAARISLYEFENLNKPPNKVIPAYACECSACTAQTDICPNKCLTTYKPCYPGYVLTNFSCIELDACATNNNNSPNCSQLCTSVNGTKRQCSCRSGYWLEFDGVQCVEFADLTYYVYAVAIPVILIITAVAGWCIYANYCREDKREGSDVPPPRDKSNLITKRGATNNSVMLKYARSEADPSDTTDDRRVGVDGEADNKFRLESPTTGQTIDLGFLSGILVEDGNEFETPTSAGASPAAGIKNNKSDKAPRSPVGSPPDTKNQSLPLQAIKNETNI